MPKSKAKTAVVADAKVTLSNGWYLEVGASGVQWAIVLFIDGEERKRLFRDTLPEAFDLLDQSIENVARNSLGKIQLVSDSRCA